MISAIFIDNDFRGVRIDKNRYFITLNTRIFESDFVNSGTNNKTKKNNVIVNKIITLRIDDVLIKTLE